VKTTIDMHEDADGVYRPKADGLGGALDDFERVLDAADGLGDVADAWTERLNAISEKRKIFRRRAPRRAEAEKV